MKAGDKIVYRREIDGLRAVAVIPVILFHAGFTVFSGGYIGVDVFFVISGYLITSILIGELERGSFSIARFYERRARRILPALFFVMLCCIPFAWMWMLPDELGDFARSVVAVTVFASNVLFYKEEGYFAPSSELKPLLHTWSLAVEEQYYVLFPVFLFLAWRFGRNRTFWVIVAMAVVSLLMSEWGWRNKPTANFYLAPTRAWEFLVGAMCAFWLTDGDRRTNNWLSVLGLALIVFAIFYYDKATPFPSVYALAPVLGTALIILFGGAGTWAGRLLGTRPFVGIGLISYSAYLWHQPMFAFARIRNITVPSPALMFALAMLSLVLAYLSWRFVEKPFRKGQGSALPTRRAVFSASALAASLFVAVGLTGYLAKGFPGRLPDSAMQALNEAKDTGKYRNECLEGPSLKDSFVMAKCNLGRSDGKVDFVVFGDSFAGAIADGFDDAARAHGKRGIVLGLHSCPPIIGAGGWWDETKKRCGPFQNAMVDVVKTLKPSLVILEAAWSALDKEALGTGSARSGYQAYNDKALATVAALKREGASVYVVCCTPQAIDGVDFPHSMAKMLMSGHVSDLRETRDGFAFRNRSALRIFRSQQFLENAHFVDLTDNYCLAAKCDLARDRRALIFDSGHLSRFGSRLLAPLLWERILSQSPDQVQGTDMSRLAERRRGAVDGASAGRWPL